jgi:ABC-type transport system involved in multi-copper enzyme maturation permease subunit
MLLWKSWFDLRLRFYCSLAVILVLLAAITAMYPMLSSVKTADPYAQAQIHRISEDYKFYMNLEWFVGNGRTCLYIVTILLALGGVPAEQKRGALLMTLSLPLPRWLWVLMHAAMTALLILILSFVSPLGVAVGSFFIGKSYPHLFNSVLPVMGTWLPCFPWIGVSLLVNSFLRSPMKSALIVIPFILLIPSFVGLMFPAFNQWCPWVLGNPDIWRQSIPWRPLVSTLLIGLGCTVLTAYKFSQEEC